MTKVVQARYLLAKLNPSQTHDDSVFGSSFGTEVIVTEDVSFEVFYRQLQKLAVNTG